MTNQEATKLVQGLSQSVIAQLLGEHKSIQFLRLVEREDMRSTCEPILIKLFEEDKIDEIEIMIIESGE